jgi:HK97 family phage portal protein
MMNFLQRINSSIEVKGTQPEGNLTLQQPLQSLDLNDIRFIGNEVKYYPADNGQRFITYGYKGNDAVYSIVSKNSEKAGQVRFYHSKIDKDEKKTLQEYKALLKGFVGNPKEAKELHLMRKSMIDELEVKGALSRLLDKPNRYQSQGSWIENIFGHRELTGEGNIWFNRGNGARTLEMFCIPKFQLNLVGNGQDPFEVVAYEFMIQGATYRWEKDAVAMWVYNNPTEITPSLEHMRGMAPLEAFIIALQGMNEGDKRLTASNKNAGAYGFAYWKNAKELGVAQKQEMRNAFDNIVNSSEMAGKVAVLAGEWGYHNIGLSVDAQKLLEQYNIGFQRLCRVFKTSHGVFNDDAKYANGPQYKRDWIYDKIAPNIYQLRAILDDKLIPEFGLDPETNLVDCDIMSLPEMNQDLKDQVAAVKDANWLTLDEKRMATGYEPLGTPEAQKIYMNSGVATLEQINADIAPPLDEEMNMLDE